MPERKAVKITTAIVKELLAEYSGKGVKEITLEKLRSELQIKRDTDAFDDIRGIMFQLAKQNIVRMLERGQYKIIRQVTPVPVFSIERERRPPFDLTFPRVFESMEEMSFAKEIVVREGDLITIGGVKSKGKTHLCLNIAGENIDVKPILMGNEYTVLIPDKNDETKEIYDLAPRFLSRLDTMDVNKGGWIDWIDVDGNDKFTLLPVTDDYAEHIVKNKINIIDWINMDGDKSYDISRILGGIKKNLGRGIAIVALQKSESSDNPRGGQFVRDFSDLEILLDGFGQDNSDDILLTLKGAKEKHSPIVGKTFAYTILNGVKTVNFREVKKCGACKGQGYKQGVKCDLCFGHKYIDAIEEF